MGDMVGHANFSACGKYRWTLGRQWDAKLPRINWIMLNPSTADQHVLDPTIRRCLGYSIAWGFGSLVVTNLFALRSTDPQALYAHRTDPLRAIGEENDWHIRHEAEKADHVLVAWGLHGAFASRSGWVYSKLLDDISVYCLGRTAKGEPKHPLYLRGDTTPEPYHPYSAEAA